MNSKNIHRTIKIGIFARFVKDAQTYKKCTKNIKKVLKKQQPITDRNINVAN